MTNATLIPPTTPGIAEAPRDAFRFALSPMQFAKPKEDETGIYPFQMTARSGEEINHWYWGRIIHDMDGMQLRKDRVTVDYQHEYDAVIGYADKFSAGPDGLEVSGALVSTKQHDKAFEVYAKGKAGVPYESSIDWEGPGAEVEWIPEGVSTEVNGRQFEGPGYVVRKWPLRAIAVCRYGSDPDTRTQFSNQTADQVSVCQFSLKGPEMADSKPTTTDDKKETPTEAKQQTEQKPAATAPATAAAGMISLDTVKQFSSEFGAKGTEYLSQGLSLDAARFQFAIHERDTAREESRQLSEKLTAKETRITELETQLKQFGGSLGQETPVETDGDGKGGKEDPRAKQFAVHGGDNRGKFAAAMKLKGQS